MIDIRKPRTIHLTPDKNHLPAGHCEKPHAILLPDFGLVFPNFVGLNGRNWKDAVKKGNNYELYDSQCATPEASEMALTIDRSKFPCFDPTVYPNLSIEKRYWTATVDPDPSSPGCAYVVHFDYGYVLCYDQLSGGFVLPVLRVAPGQYSAFGIEG